MNFDDKTINKKTIYEGKILGLEVRQLQNSQGLVYEREIVRRSDAVAVVAIENDDVVLVRQYRAPLDKPILEIPAGIVENNDPQKTAYNELIEEAGYKAGSLTLLTKFFTSSGFSDEVVHIYQAFDLTEVSPEPEEEEIIEIVKIPLKQAISDIKSGKIEDAKTIIGLMLANEG